MKKIGVFFVLLIVACIPFLSACKTKPNSSTGEGEKTPEKQEAVAETVDEKDIAKVRTEPTFVFSEIETDYGEIYPAFYVADDMLLQRRKVNVIKGKSYTASHVAVRINETVYYGELNEGDFCVYLPPMEAMKGLTLEIITEDAKRTVKNVAIGELFLCAGQSNMAWQVGYSSSYYTELIETADYKDIRLFNMPKAEKSYASLTANAKWMLATKGNISTFSLFGLLYAISMQKELEIPIGVVNASVGSTLLCYWLPRESFKALEKRSAVYVNYEKSVFSPSLGFNGMISPLRDMTFRGMVWYQGESNGYKANLYAGELKELINAYRDFFDDEKLTVTVVGLPRYNAELQERWAAIRVAQRAAVAQFDYAVYTENIDLGDSEDIHPRKKDLIASRAAGITLDEFFYGNESRQTFAVAAEKNGLEAMIDVSGGGGLTLKNGANGFEFSSDGVSWRSAAEASIRDGKLVVTASEEFRYIRYGYKSDYEKEAPESEQAVGGFVSAFNEYGLPLGQFLFRFK
ncbi:MAG: hypothetical protein IJY62_01025 [Clostridia bacterium]|nr:hypothetical protein [Clostridia bacterium]